MARNLLTKDHSMFKNLACAFVLALPAATAFAETPCERLTSLKLPNATITSALAVPKGPYLPLGLPADAAQNPKMQTPAHCRVAVRTLRFAETSARGGCQMRAK
jgi:hypothetical protein